MPWSLIIYAMLSDVNPHYLYLCMPCRRFGEMSSDRCLSCPVCDRVYRWCIVVKRLDGLGCYVVWKPADLGPRHIVLDGDPAPPTPERCTATPPLFGTCLLWPNGRPSQQLLSSCYSVHASELCPVLLSTFCVLITGQLADANAPTRGLATSRML